MEQVGIREQAMCYISRGHNKSMKKDLGEAGSIQLRGFRPDLLRSLLAGPQEVEHGNRN
jgi:hypothetical protein